MNQYLAFRCGIYRFMLPARGIVELFDANASPEPLQQVLAGDSRETYWRGVRASLVDMKTYLGEPGETPWHCYVACQPSEDASQRIILRVQAIDRLLNLPEQAFQPMPLQQAGVSRLSRQVCRLPGEDTLLLVISPESVTLAGHETPDTDSPCQV